MYRITAAATGSPTHVIANMRKGDPPDAVNSPNTTILVDVPTSVSMPPTIAA
jgi:hypothetical protein